MKEIKMDRKDYILLSQQELDTLLNEAHATAYIDDRPLQQLNRDDLSATECRFIRSLRENVKRYEKTVVQQSKMDGKGLSFFRFHLGDIGGE